MTKFKKLKLRSYAFLTLALALGVAGAWHGVKAYQSSNAPQNLAEQGGTIIVNNNYEAPENAIGAEEEMFGAVTGPALPNPYCQADRCVYTATGDFKDASTTFVSLLSPNLKVTSTAGGVIVKTEGGVNWTSATTSVTLVRLNQTGANTSSYSASCHATTGAVATGQIHLDRFLITSTPAAQAFATNSLGVWENNMTALQGNRINGGSVPKIMLGPSHPYFTCLAELNADGSASMTNADNTFAGKYQVIFEWPRY